MNEQFQIVNLQLGEKFSQQSSSSSFKKEIVIQRKEEPIKQKPLELIQLPTIQKPQQKKPLIVNKPLLKIPKYDKNYIASIDYNCIREDSMLDSIKTGFGIELILRRECKRPKYKQHLCKENYLNEFESFTEKQLARNNLGVYSKEEVSDILEKILAENENKYVTKPEVEEMLAKLDYVDSELKSTVDYTIPETLFKL